jgi:proteic killer suppression protein
LTLVSHSDNMIISFGSKQTEKIYQAERVAKLPLDIQHIGLRKLILLDQSQDIKDLMIPLSNRLEKLKGNMKEYYSIRINDQWRIILKWVNNNAREVEIIDYH